MTRKTLTIEYDTNQKFFEGGDDSLLGYLANEFDNDGIVARLEEGDTVRLPRTIDRAARLRALQVAVERFEDNAKHAVLTGRKVDYAPPPPWFAPLVRDLHTALEASKVEQ